MSGYRARRHDTCDPDPMVPRITTPYPLPFSPGPPLVLILLFLFVALGPTKVNQCGEIGFFSVYAGWGYP